MSYRRLFLLVEGDDDERFFRSVVLPLLSSAYHDIQVVRISTLKKEKVNGLLRSIAGMKADYILVHDLDQHPCATAAKDSLLKSFPPASPDRIQIVKGEIESWYCAGIPEDHPWRSLPIGRCPDTRVVTKEAFAAATLHPGQPRLPAMLDLLKSFDLQVAIRRNESFQRFLRKFIPGF
ncbi:MAG TPA: hypothetical protein VF789_26265 [Thermoanaerobaculia bacterium]